MSANGNDSLAPSSSGKKATEKNKHNAYIKVNSNDGNQIRVCMAEGSRLWCRKDNDLKGLEKSQGRW